MTATITWSRTRCSGSFCWFMGKTTNSLGIDLQLDPVFAGELVAFIGVLVLHPDGELKRAGLLGYERAAGADLEGGPLIPDASDECAPWYLPRNEPAVILHAVRPRLGIVAPGGHDDAPLGLDR